MLDVFFFYAFAALVLGGALLTVTLRNTVHCAISLIASLSGVAGIFLLQKAEFLFAVQIIVYVGGVMVLFLFVIMLVNLDTAARDRQFNRQWIAAVACVLAIGAEGVYFVRSGSGAWTFAAPSEFALSAGNTEDIARMLFSEYLVPFEIASVLLLVAVVGSVLMARREA